jgi:hypothetical protein
LITKNISSASAKKFFGKMAFSFNLYRNDGNQATVTSGE